MFIGIGVGVCAATLQSICYILSRSFLTRYGGPVRLMIASQLCLGLVSAVLLVLLAPPEFFGPATIPGAALCSGGYIVGQFAFFSAQQKIECSRVASLYSLKILVVSLLAALLVGESLTVGGIAAVLLAVAAVFLINHRRGAGFDHRGMGVLALAITAFSFSDIGGKMLLDLLTEYQVPHFPAGLITVSCGSLPAALLLCPVAWQQKIRKEEFAAATPYAVIWFIAVACTFIGFSYLGATFGNVVQSSRGVISLILGIVMAHLGVAGQEPQLPASAWIKRGIGAVLMFLAILLFATLGRPAGGP